MGCEIFPLESNRSLLEDNFLEFNPLLVTYVTTYVFFYPVRITICIYSSHQSFQLIYQLMILVFKAQFLPSLGCQQADSVPVGILSDRS